MRRRRLRSARSRSRAVRRRAARGQDPHLRGALAGAPVVERPESRSTAAEPRLEAPAEPERHQRRCATCSTTILFAQQGRDRREVALCGRCGVVERWEVVSAAGEVVAIGSMDRERARLLPGLSERVSVQAPPEPVIADPEPPSHPLAVLLPAMVMQLELSLFAAAVAAKASQPTADDDREDEADDLA